VDADESALRDDLEEAAFRAGLILQRWRIVDLTWPFLTVGVVAAPRESGPAEYVLRLECGGYRAIAPLGQFWDTERSEPLGIAHRPSRAEPQRDECFKNFPALYTGFDRAGLKLHSNWANDMPSHSWRPGSTIAVYLRGIYDLLNSPRYLGVNVA